MKLIFEELGGTYTLGEDGIYYPDIVIVEEEEPKYGKYGMLRRIYLKDHKKNLYDSFLLSGKLICHLNEIDDTANARKELLLEKMMIEKGITEELKETDWGKWIGEMNIILQVVEEIILQDLIYC